MCVSGVSSQTILQRQRTVLIAGRLIFCRRALMRWKRDALMQQREFPLDPHTLARIPRELSESISRIPYFWQRKILISKARSGEKISDRLLQPIDYSYRPASYWVAEGLCQLVANIKGAERKKKALQLVE